MNGPLGKLMIAHMIAMRPEIIPAKIQSLNETYHIYKKQEAIGAMIKYGDKTK